MRKAVASVRKLARHFVWLPFSRTRFMAGKRMEMSRAIMPITASNSTSVKPRSREDLCIFILSDQLGVPKCRSLFHSIMYGTAYRYCGAPLMFFDNLLCRCLNRHVFPTATQGLVKGNEVG